MIDSSGDVLVMNLLALLACLPSIIGLHDLHIRYLPLLREVLLESLLVDVFGQVFHTETRGRLSRRSRRSRRRRWRGWWWDYLSSLLLPRFLSPLSLSSSSASAAEWVRLSFVHFFQQGHSTNKRLPTTIDTKCINLWI